MARATTVSLPHFALPALPSGLPGLRLFGETAAPPVRVRDDAVEKARRDALAEAQAKFDLVRAADRAEHEQMLAAQEKANAEQVATVLVERMAAGLKGIGDSLAAEVARVLSRFLTTAVREHALGELAETVKALLVGNAGAAVRVAGPPALVEALRQRLAQPGGDIAFATVGAPDVTITLNDTVIRSAIADWGARLAAAIGEDARG